MRALLILESLWRPAFALFGQKFPKVSSRIQENSRFLETRLGDRRMNPLRAGRGSTLWSPPHRPYAAAGELRTVTPMSALGGKADIERASRDFAY